MADAADIWWKSLPCHLNPEWNLKGDIKLDVRRLKQRVDWDLEDGPEFMPIESLLYRAFLEVAPSEGFLMMGRSSPDKALKFLNEAEEQVKRIWSNDKDAQNSYKLVINAFRMWLHNDGNFKESSIINDLTETLRKLKSAVDANPTPHIDVTRATALTRLGFQRYDDAIELFDKALGVPKYSENTHWMFCRAMLIGRKARNDRTIAKGVPSNEEGNIFSEERSILEDVMTRMIRENDPTSATVKAHLGKCLYNMKDRPQGLRYLREAHQQSPSNREIAGIYAQVLRWKNKYTDLKESKAILSEVKDYMNSEETCFQLGLVYRKMSKHPFLSERDKTDYLNEAFKLVDQAINLDSNHIPALTIRAELAVELGRKNEAKKLYSDIFKGGNMSPGQLFTARCSYNDKHEENSDPKGRLDNAYRILTLCADNFVEVRDNVTVGSGRREFWKPYRKGTEVAFAVIESETNTESELQLDALRFRSDIMFRLDDFQTAIDDLTVLRARETRSEYIPEILLRHGKCLCALGDDGAAEEVLNELSQQLQAGSDDCRDVRELEADIYLLRAKSMLETSGIDNIDHHGAERDAVRNLRMAIKLGSVEACYVYLTKVKNLAEQVSCNNGTAGIIADIKRCLEREDRIHEIFNIDDQPVAGIPVNTTVEDLMRNILTYPKKLDGLPHLLKTRYESITSIRSSLVDFQYTFMYTCGEKWGQECQEKAEKTLTDTKQLLDHIIYSWQRAVLDKKVPETKFPIHNKDTKNKTVEQKFDGYLQKYFHKADPPVPPDIKKYIISLQPMVDPENNWLNALSSFVNDAKHTGSDYGDAVKVEGKMGESYSYKKEDLVRISCCKVEAIAVKLLEYVQYLFDSQKTKPGFLLEYEREVSGLITGFTNLGILDT